MAIWQQLVQPSGNPKQVPNLGRAGVVMITVTAAGGLTMPYHGGTHSINSSTFIPALPNARLKCNMPLGGVRQSV